MNGVKIIKTDFFLPPSIPFILQPVHPPLSYMTEQRFDQLLLRATCVDCCWFDAIIKEFADAKVRKQKIIWLI